MYTNFGKFLTRNLLCKVEFWFEWFAFEISYFFGFIRKRSHEISVPFVPISKFSNLRLDGKLSYKQALNEILFSFDPKASTGASVSQPQASESRLMCGVIKTANTCALYRSFVSSSIVSSGIIFVWLT